MINDQSFWPKWIRAAEQLNQSVVTPSIWCEVPQWVVSRDADVYINKTSHKWSKSQDDLIMHRSPAAEWTLLETLRIRFALRSAGGHFWHEMMRRDGMWGFWIRTFQRFSLDGLIWMDPRERDRRNKGFFFSFLYQHERPNPLWVTDPAEYRKQFIHQIDFMQYILSSHPPSTHFFFF